MRKKGFLLLLFISAAGILSAQTRREILHDADEAFKRSDYATAAFFYLGVLNQNPDAEARAFPFEVRSIQLPEKVKKDSSQQKIAADTSKKIASDTSKTIPVNTVKKDSTKKDGS